MANKGLWIGCGSFCCALIITGIVLFSISFRSLEATEFGIRYNSFSKQIDETKIYDEGTYFLGPSIRFIKFPIEVKAINFGGNPVRVRTSDGMRLSISISLQYKLNKKLDVTLQLLRKYGENNYESVIERVAQDTVRVTASGFTIDQYVYSRQDISTAMTANLTVQMNNLGVNLENFQLTDVKFPDQLSSVILDTQRLQIDMTNAQNNKVFRVQEANNNLNKSFIDAQNQLQSARTAIIARMSTFNQMASVYTSFVDGYITQLATRAPIYGDSLWINEFNDLINDRVSSGTWTIKEVVPTPAGFKNNFNQ